VSDDRLEEIRERSEGTMAEVPTAGPTADLDDPNPHAGDLAYLLERIDELERENEGMRNAARRALDTWGWDDADEGIRRIAEGRVDTDR
jgi:hypothetical protein